MIFNLLTPVTLIHLKLLTHQNLDLEVWPTYEKPKQWLLFSDGCRLASIVVFWQLLLLVHVSCFAFACATCNLWYTSESFQKVIMDSNSRLIIVMHLDRIWGHLVFTSWWLFKQTRVNLCNSFSAMRDTDFILRTHDLVTLTAWPLLQKKPV